jgi:hypothetical protein
VISLKGMKQPSLQIAKRKLERSGWDGK